MKTNHRIIFILIFLLTSGVTVLCFEHNAFSESKAAKKYYCPMHPNYTSDKPGDCPICGMRLVLANDAAPLPVAVVPDSKPKTKKILFYRHPMQPDISSPVPAKDEMGMDYIPVYEEESLSQDPKSVCIFHECPMIKAGEKCPMLILAEPGEELECPVCKGKINLESSGSPLGASLVQGYATVMISPQKQQMIGVKTSLVERRAMTKSIRTVGRIAYDPELYQVQAEYIQALKHKDEAWGKGLVESARTKLTLMGLSEDLIEEIGKSDGPDKSLLYSIAGGSAWVYANVYEYELPLVSVGDMLEIEAAASPGTKLKGTLRSIDKVVDPMTRSVRVRAQVPNEEGFLKPDMFVNVSVVANLGEVLAVPDEAVFFAGTSNTVFVDKGQGLFEPRPVVVGQKADGAYEIKEGLSEGEKVITNGNFLVDSESRLKAALNSMVEQHKQGS